MWSKPWVITICSNRLVINGSYLRLWPIFFVFDKKCAIKCLQNKLHQLEETKMHHTIRNLRSKDQNQVLTGVLGISNIGIGTSTFGTQAFNKTSGLTAFNSRLTWGPLNFMDDKVHPAVRSRGVFFEALNGNALRRFHGNFFRGHLIYTRLFLTLNRSSQPYFSPSLSAQCAWCCFSGCEFEILKIWWWGRQDFLNFFKFG